MQQAVTEKSTTVRRSRQLERREPALRFRMVTNDTPMLSSRFEDALAFASHLHARQTRKAGAIPYVAHLLSVCALVLEDGGQEDDAIAALLHDAVEDQGGLPTLVLIRERYGDEVARLVEACTDSDTVPKAPWLERKERYVNHLRQADARVRRITCADKLHNARSVLYDYRAHGENLWARFTGTREQTLWYYRTIADICVATGTGPLAAELARVVGELEALVGRS
jgi:(p)ppGpp synthase/HD superfamily hydrolase